MSKEFRYADFRHFMNTVFMYLRRYSKKGIDYDQENFCTIQQMHQVYYDLQPRRYTWDLMHDDQLIYEDNTQDWISEQLQNDYLYKKRQKYNDDNE